MKGKESTSMLPYILLSVVVGLVGVAEGRNGCSPACGLNTIMYPFRLRGDPAFCGVLEYELICEGNKTILELDPVKYFVTKISYSDHTLQVVDPKSESGNCSLPSKLPRVSSVEGISGTLTYGTVDEIVAYDIVSSKPNYQLLSASWAVFVNCSVKIQDRSYHFIPCLSTKDILIYGLYGVRGGVEELLPNCRFMSRVPITDDFCFFKEPITDDFDTNPVNITNVFQLLQKGFTVAWGDKYPSKSQVFQYCLGSASRRFRSDNQGRSIFIWLLYPFPFGKYVLDCLQGDEYLYIPHVLALPPLVVIICLDTAIVLLVIAILIRCILAPLIIYVFLATEYWKVMVPIDTIEKFLRNQQTLTPARYAYSDIIAMTSHFNEKLGQGGFGMVYKGELPGGRLVAIKMLGISKFNGDEFINEISTIGRIHHTNIVRLVGFCSEGSKRALVYEFMPNGSLDKCIFSSNGTRRRFTQEKLNQIALGVARGIDYLHRGCDMRILHFDIKPHNILLDHNFNPKVSDFGLAKLCPKDYSLVSLSAARGTIGYIAPELVSRSFGIISYKSDVYSFGMLLLEMAGGRRNVDNRAGNSSEVYYPSWIYDRLLQSEGPEICISIEIDDMERKLCKVGLWCIQMRPADRPSMSRVIEMLQAEADTLQMPPKPFFSTSGPVSLRQSFMDSFSSDLSIISEDE